MARPLNGPSRRLQEVSSFSTAVAGDLPSLHAQIIDEHPRRRTHRDRSGARGVHTQPHFRMTSRSNIDLVTPGCPPAAFIVAERNARAKSQAADSYGQCNIHVVS